MRRQTPIAHLLYNYLFPRPTPTDPPSFAAHLARNLVPEVRIEVSTFYGDLNSVEARYPGLNYCYPPHRMRLGRFKHHRRLFDAFDSLALTYNEIQDFCCWEGTKWARERYEKDEGISVLDTTGDDIAPYIDRRHCRVSDDELRRKISRHTQIEVLVEEARDGPVVLSSNNFMGSSLHPRPPHHHHYPHDHSPAPDAEMSDVDSLASVEEDSDEAEDDDDASSNATLPSHHRPHGILPPVSSIPSHILSAWEQGHQLPPELEQFLKDHAGGGGGGGEDATDARLLPAGFDLRPLLSPSAAAAAAAAAASAAAGAAGRAATTTTTGRAAAA
ncbi:hypothetical protein KC364_g13965 [Hortaea werneckii]|nr:hypothetical protein KC350_g1831 [Hortaea werneckii]KAI7440385.1 hypothetical protein KC364_g13965 [Hortaea werneckii]